MAGFRRRSACISFTISNRSSLERKVAGLYFWLACGASESLWDSLRGMVLQMKVEVYPLSFLETAAGSIC